MTCLRVTVNSLRIGMLNEWISCLRDMFNPAVVENGLDKPLYLIPSLATILAPCSYTLLFNNKSYYLKLCPIMQLK